MLRNFSFPGAVYSAAAVDLGGGQQQQTPPQDTAPQAPWAAEGTWTVGEGDKAQPWTAFLPEPAREAIKGNNFANPAAVVDAYINLRKLQSGAADVFTAPGKDAKPEAWDRVFKAIGRPDTPDGYKFEYPNGFKPDEHMEKFGKSLLHKMGVPAHMANDAMTMWNGFVEEQNKRAADAEVAANEQQVAAIRQKLGDQFDTHMAAGRRVVEALGLSKEDVAAIEGAIGAGPLINLMTQLGLKTKEMTFVPNSKPAGEGAWDTKSEAEIDAEIARLNGDAEFQKKYTDGTHPENANAKEQMKSLFEAKFKKTNPK